MGSPLRLTIVEPIGADPNGAEADWATVSDDVERSEAAMSRFRPGSDITILNNDVGSGARSVGPRLYAALAAAHRAWCRTGGLFDPRILGDLERLGYHGADLAPTPQPDFERSTWLTRDPRRGALVLDSPIDLGGIGKGLALRWAMRALLRRRQGAGPLGALLEAGGDIVAIGRPPQGGRWQIGIEAPDGRDQPVAVVEIRGGAVCTSSVRINRWLDDTGRLVHHLIDPRTGEPGGVGLASVTVAFPDPAWAEVWTKTAFLEGPTRIGERLRSLGVAGWWVADDGTLSMTPAGRLTTVWTRDEAAVGIAR